MRYIAYELSPESRAKVLEQFPPKYSEVIARHITAEFGVKSDHPLPPRATIEVEGYADDGNGLEALVVKVNGTHQRPDGRVYHLTLSLDPSKNAPAAFDLDVASGDQRERPYAPTHSNGLIRNRGFTQIAVPFTLAAVPKNLERTKPELAQPAVFKLNDPKI